MNKFKKLYYQLTAYVPRKLPQTEDQFLDFINIMRKAYDLKDEPQTYVVISGQIQSTEGHRLRKPWGNIANNVKRVKINALAQCYKVAANEQMKYDLDQKVKEATDAIREDERNKAEGLAHVSNEKLPDSL